MHMTMAFFPPSLQLSSFLPVFNRAGKKAEMKGRLEGAEVFLTTLPAAARTAPCAHGSSSPARSPQPGHTWPLGGLLQEPWRRKQRSHQSPRGHTRAINYCHQQKEHAEPRCSMRGVSHSPKFTSHHRLRYSCSTVTHQPQPLFSCDSLEPLWSQILNSLIDRHTYRTKGWKDLWCPMKTS